MTTCAYNIQHASDQPVKLISVPNLKDELFLWISIMYTESHVLLYKQQEIMLKWNK